MRIAWFCLIVAVLASSVAKVSGSELRISLAPRVSLPNDSPLFSEDTVNFYGTNITLLTSRFLRVQAETQLHKAIPSSLRVEATRIANTSIISVVASGADENIAAPFLSALFDQFIRYKREQKEKYYRDAINAVDLALSSAPPECTARLRTYRDQLVIASLLDVKPVFERIEF